MMQVICPECGAPMDYDPANTGPQLGRHSCGTILYKADPDIPLEAIERPFAILKEPGHWIIGYLETVERQEPRERHYYDAEFGKETVQGSSAADN